MSNQPNGMPLYEYIKTDVDRSPHNIQQKEHDLKTVGNNTDFTTFILKFTAMLIVWFLVIMWID